MKGDTETLADLPNLRHIRAFIMTVRHRSVKRAAQAVFLSQPAVTQAIGNLEVQFEQTLFDRSVNGMFLTEMGEILRRRVDLALNELALACRPPGLRRETGCDDPARNLSAAQLRAIVAIANHGNFTGAARALGMSRPSVQRTARNLEKVVGYPLFVPSSRGIRLSPAGEHFARCSKLFAREIELAREEMNQYAGQKIGRMVIGSLPLSLVELVPKALLGVLERIPDLDVRIVEGPYEDQLKALLDGDADLVVGAMRDPVPCDEVVQHRLFADPLSIVVRTGHPLTRQRHLTLSDTIGYAWVLPHRGTPTRDLFHKAFRRRALAEPKRILEVSSHSTLRALLTSSDRVALVSRRQVCFEVEAGTLTVLPVELGDTFREIGVTTRVNWTPSVAQRMLLAEMERIASGYALPAATEERVSRIRKDISRARG